MFIAGSCGPHAASTTPQAVQLHEPNAQTEAGSIIQVQDWAKPQPGWLYVLDPKPKTGETYGQIWLLNPETSKVMGSIRTGPDPDFALSPDGTRLYVASERTDPSDDLAVIDTASGTVLLREIVEGRVAADAIPSYSGMSVTRDGLLLRVLVNKITPQDNVGFQLLTFDTQTGKFLPGRIHLGGCNSGRLIPFPTSDQFDFLCPGTNRIHVIRVDAHSREIKNSPVMFPWPRRTGVAEAFPSLNGKDTTIIRGDGAVFNVDVATGNFDPTPMNGDFTGRILPAAWPSSPDGSKIYLGYNSIPDDTFYLNYGRPPNLRSARATADEFQVIEVGTWRKLGEIKTTVPFWSAAVSNDGSSLYALVPNQHTLLVIDTTAMRETRAISVGGSPALALVAPGKTQTQAMK
jgi:DNA-binding beta-propeller fold protein YncE